MFSLNKMGKRKKKKKHYTFWMKLEKVRHSAVLLMGM